MGRKAERTRYFVGTADGHPTGMMVTVEIGSPADRACLERYRQRYQWDTIKETDLMGYTAYLRRYKI